MTVITLGFRLIERGPSHAIVSIYAREIERLRTRFFNLPKKYEKVLEENRRLRIENRHLKSLELITAYDTAKRTIRDQDSSNH